MESLPTSLKQELNFKLEVEINSNKNNSFGVKFSANSYSYLLIEAKQKNDNFMNKTYSNKFTIDKIKENKYFYMFDDLKEICNELSERLKTNEIKLIENKKNLILLINLPISTIKEINLI